jgi:hypothetical protein
VAAAIDWLWGLQGFAAIQLLSRNSYFPRWWCREFILAIAWNIFEAQLVVL